MKTGMILGLDIGTNSIGWALVGQNEDGATKGIIRAGVRIFSAGVDGDIATGHDESRSVKRRMARGRRRLLERRARRLVKIAHALQNAGLLPAGDVSTGKKRMDFFQQLDRKIFSIKPDRFDPHRLFYELRAFALDERLEPYEIGRAIYHLAQRRGFKSGRKDLKASDDRKIKKAPVKKDDDPEGLKAEIASLEEEVRNAGYRSYGEYFAHSLPETRRIRGRHLGRIMIREEFRQICEVQAKYHPKALNSWRTEAIANAIFHQRPLKSAAHLIGKCDLEKGRRRAPIAHPLFQRFRLLQKLNDLAVTTEGGGKELLTPEQRAAILLKLESQGSLTLGAKLRKELKILSGRFNFETDKDNVLIGNRTAEKMRKVFADQWDSLELLRKINIIDALLTIDEDDKLTGKAQEWGLDETQTAQLMKTVLEEGYGSFSLRAIRKLLPRMEEGIALATVKKEIYPERESRALDELPPLNNVVKVRNPAVERTLTELRKVVNAIVRKYGKPEEIRVELARDLKRNRQDRIDISKTQKENEKERKAAAVKFLSECGREATRDDILKFQLWEECNKECPYTGLTISFDALFGPHPQFDIEHIIPYSRCLDDSFTNKTLCSVDENRRVKLNRTPFEAYAGDPEKYSRIIGLVSRFQGRHTSRKLAWFKLEEIPEGFTSRHLNDTRYASKLAMLYLGKLYGCVGATGNIGHKKIIQAGRGSMTSKLRDQWGMNGILNDSGAKTRDDHRHHAVDALVIALSDAGTLNRLSVAASHVQPGEMHRNLPDFTPPWPELLEESRNSIKEIIVSHRPEHRLSGGLHDETIYSKRKPMPGQEGKTVTHTRKEIGELFPVAKTVDKAVREALEARLGEFGDDAKKAFGNKDNPPRLNMTSGKSVSIIRARVLENVSTVSLGAEDYAREIKPNSNHHAILYEIQDKKGKTKWDSEVVDLLTAMRYHRELKSAKFKGSLIQWSFQKVQAKVKAAVKFKYSILGGDIFTLLDDEKKETLYQMRTIKTSGQFEFVKVTDSRMKKDIIAAKQWMTGMVEPMRKKGFCKVTVSPIGDIIPAHD